MSGIGHAPFKYFEIHTIYFNAVGQQTKDDATIGNERPVYGSGNTERR